MFSFSPLTIVCVVVAVAFIIAYFKSLPTDMRAQQAKILANGATTAAFAAGKVAKEVVTAATKAGHAAANEVQLTHKEAISEFEKAFDAKLAEHGGARKYGVAIGEAINDATMITSMNKNLAETIAAQKERAAKLEAHLAAK